MAFVLDASVALAWLIDSERMVATDALLDRAAVEGVVAPSLLIYEIANRLGRAVRTGELSRDQAHETLRFFTSLDLEFVQLHTLALVDSTVDTGLTSYDAAYLQVASTRGAPLATLDRKLRAAAEAAGVAVLPERIS
ncbi:MAG TPA: type II toxin-antitoxin system VapC family toxin [Microbacterium sp.]|nr:type II toxin-antitoxin system VapC family toxin [Microbacterium sp.]